MLQVVADAGHFRLSARFQTASDAMMADARWRICLSSAFGATWFSVSILKCITVPRVLTSVMGNQPL